MDKVPFQGKRKLLLLHGLAINSSRVKLVSIKKGFEPQDIVVYEEGFDVGAIKGDLMTIPLLSEQRLIILENPPEDFTLDSFNLDSLTIILWFDHEVSQKPVIEWIKKLKGEILFFPEAKEISVFPFLDRLANGEKQAFLEMDRLKKSGYDVFYLITMVFYLLRSLTVTPKNAPQFVKQKLDRQRKRFELEDIKNLYEYILEIDFKIKSGLLEKDQAEFLLVNKFLSSSSYENNKLRSNG